MNCAKPDELQCAPEDRIGWPWTAVLGLLGFRRPLVSLGAAVLECSTASCLGPSWPIYGRTAGMLEPGLRGWLFRRAPDGKLPDL